MVNYFAIAVVLAISSSAITGRSWHGIHDHDFFKQHGDRPKPWLGGPPPWGFPDHPWKFHGGNDKYDDYEYWPDHLPEPDTPNWNGWGFPDSDVLVPNTPRVPTPTTSKTTSTTSPVLTTLLCIRSCPVTPEYNPVCGTNNVTYGNPGRLECAKNCGVDVSLQRSSPCAPLRTTSTVTPITNPTTAASNSSSTQAAPTTTPNSVTNNNTSTRSPITNEVNPTRYTTIDFNPSSSKQNDNNPSITIPYDVLASVFNNPTSSETTTEVTFDIRFKEDV